MKFKNILVLITAIFISISYTSAQVKTISADALKTMINDCNHDSNYILLDVRDVSEVKDGIIASDYCKPYHMSFNTKELENNYTIFPKDMPIYIYCRSGNRSQQAGNLLSNNGFQEVYSMSGGINAYTGTLHDSTELKKWNALSMVEPSFLKDNCITAVSRSPLVRTLPIPRSRGKQFFTLQGRQITQPSNQQHPPVFILERIEGERGGKINGLHRLIQRGE